MESEKLPRGCGLDAANSPSRVKRPTLFFDNDHECRELSVGLFGQLDLDHNGSLDMVELEYARQILSAAGVDANGAMSKPLGAFGDLSSAVIDMLGHVDHDGDGTIDMEEWDDFIRSVYEIAGRQSFTVIVQRWVSAVQARQQSAGHPRTLQPISDHDSIQRGQHAGTDSSTLSVSGTGRHRGEINRGARNLQHVPLAPVQPSSPSNSKSEKGRALSPVSASSSRSVSPMPSRNGSPASSRQPSPSPVSGSSAPSKLAPVLPVKDRKKFATTGTSSARNLAKLPTSQLKPVEQVQSGVIQFEPKNDVTRVPCGRFPEPKSPRQAPPAGRLAHQRRRVSNAKFSSEQNDKSNSQQRQLMPETRTFGPADVSSGMATDSATGQGDMAVDAGDSLDNKLRPDEDPQPVADSKGSPFTGDLCIGTAPQASQVDFSKVIADNQNGAASLPKQRRADPALTSKRRNSEMQSLRQPAASTKLRRPSEISDVGLSVVSIAAPRSQVRRHTISENHDVQEEQEVQRCDGPTLEVKSAPIVQSRLRGKQAHQQVNSGSSGRSRAEQASKGKPQALETQAEDQTSGACNQSRAPTPILEDTSYEDVTSLGGTTCTHGSGLQDTSWAEGSSLGSTTCTHGSCQQDTTCADGKGTPRAQEPDCASGSCLEGTIRTNRSGPLDTTCASGSSLEATTCAHETTLEDELELLMNECQVGLGIATELQQALDASPIMVSTTEDPSPFCNSGSSHAFEGTLSDSGADTLAFGDEAVYEADPLVDSEEMSPTRRGRVMVPNMASMAAVAKIKTMKGGAKSGKDKSPQPRRVALTQQDFLAGEQPLITLEEVWELVATDRGKMNSRVPVFDLVEIFVDAKESGLGPALANLVPHSFTEPEPPEDLSPGEVLDICMMLVHEDVASVTEEHVRRQLSPIRDYCRLLAFKDLCIDTDAHLTLIKFKQLLHLLSTLLRVDQPYILSHFMWVKTGRFETTDALAALVVNRCSLRRENARQRGIIDEVLTPEAGSSYEPGLSVLYEGFTTGDFCRLCIACNVVDAKAKTGIPFTHIQVIYLNCIRYLNEHVKKRAEHRTPLGKTSYSEIYEQAQRSFRLHMEHRQQSADLKRLGQTDAKGAEGGTILGRTEFSILIEKLFEGIKKNCPAYKGPLELCLAVLEKPPDEMVSVSQIR